MSFNLAEFLPLMLVFILAVISPGPDFVLILRQALLQGRRAALLSSTGIGAAMLVHVSYTILGLGLIIAQSLLLFNIVKWAGVAYLFYLGFQAFTSQQKIDHLLDPQTSPQQNDHSLLEQFPKSVKRLKIKNCDKKQTVETQISDSIKSHSALKAFLTGFAINLLNPKAMVFFLAIFSSLVAPATPTEIKFTYGLAIATMTMSWFMLVSLMITLPSIRAIFMRLSNWTNRVTGLIFIGLGIRLIFYQSSAAMS